MREVLEIHLIRWEKNWIYEVVIKKTLENVSTQRGWQKLWIQIVAWKINTILVYWRSKALWMEWRLTESDKWCLSEFTKLSTSTWKLLLDGHHDQDAALDATPNEPRMNEQSRKAE